LHIIAVQLTVLTSPPLIVAVSTL